MMANKTIWELTELTDTRMRHWHITRNKSLVVGRWPSRPGILRASKNFLGINSYIVAILPLRYEKSI